MARRARDSDKGNAAKQQQYRDCRNAVKKPNMVPALRTTLSPTIGVRAKHGPTFRRFLISAKKPEPRVTPTYQSDSAWAGRLNRHFVAAGAEVAAALSAEPQGAALSPRPPQVCAASFRVRTITLPELSIALRGMGNSNACGGMGSQ